MTRPKASCSFSVVMFIPSNLGSPMNLHYAAYSLSQHRYLSPSATSVSGPRALSALARETNQ